MGQDRGLCVVATNCQRANERTALQASDRRIALGRVYCWLMAYAWKRGPLPNSRTSSKLLACLPAPPA